MPSRPIDDELLDQLDASVTMLGRLLAARHGEMCCESALTMPQTLTLRMLAEQDGLKISELAAFVGIKAPAASSLVDALERGGHIRREHDPADRRITRIYLTDAGKESLLESERERRYYMRRYVSVLEREDVEALIRIQRTLIETLIAETDQPARKADTWTE